MKQLTVNLGGEDRQLDFGKFWFKKFYGETTKSDPLISKNEIVLSPEKQFDFVVAIVYAGMKADAKYKKVPFDYSYDNVQEWVGDKEDTEIADIINQYAALNKSDTPGEVKPELNGHVAG